MKGTRAASIAGICALALSAPVLLLDVWISPAQLAVDYPMQYFLVSTLYLLYGLAYATFIFGFVYTGKQYESALLMTSASLTALSYVAVVIAGGALLYFHAYYNATTFAALVDLPLVVARGLFNIGTGVALLNVETSRRSLFVCAGVAAIATGIGVISDGVFHTSVSDFISIALLLVGLVIFKVMG